MREWRKLHKGIVDSEKIARVSDGAFALFALLIAKQDDAGRYPWTPTKIKALVVSRTWDVPVTEQLRTELVQAGLVTMCEGFIEIVGWEEKNGPPKEGNSRHRAPMLYDAPRVLHENSLEPVRVTEQVRNSSVLEERREEERREEERRESADAPDLSNTEGGPSEQESEDGTKDVELPEALNPPVWPEYYSLLWGVEGFKASFEAVKAWLDGKGIADEVALDKAYALRDWWPRQSPRRRRDGDPYATWQNWCREAVKAKPGGMNGTAQVGADGVPAKPANKYAGLEWGRGPGV